MIKIVEKVSKTILNSTFPENGFAPFLDSCRDRSRPIILGLERNRLAGRHRHPLSWKFPPIFFQLFLNLNSVEKAAKIGKVIWKI